MIIIMVSGKIHLSTSFYVDQVQKKMGDISPPSRDISPFFLGKGKKSIDLETVVSENEIFHFHFSENENEKVKMSENE